MVPWCRNGTSWDSSQWITWRNGPAETVSADLAKPHLRTDWPGISLLSLCCQTASHLLLSQLITVSGWTSAAPGTVSAHLIIFKKKNSTLLPSKRKCPRSKTRVTVCRHLEKKVTGEKNHSTPWPRQDWDVDLDLPSKCERIMICFFQRKVHHGWLDYIFLWQSMYFC